MATNGKKCLVRVLLEHNIITNLIECKKNKNKNKNKNKKIKK
jgi:hypothetical protein